MYVEHLIHILPHVFPIQFPVQLHSFWVMQDPLFWHFGSHSAVYKSKLSTVIWNNPLSQSIIVLYIHNCILKCNYAMCWYNSMFDTIMLLILASFVQKKLNTYLVGRNMIHHSFVPYDGPLCMVLQCLSEKKR